MDQRKYLRLLLSLYLLLTWGFSIATPLFEAPDEHHHYFTVQYIADTGRLPTTLQNNLARQEAAQPPLYYLLAAALIAPINTGAVADQLWPNPYADILHAQPTANVNAFIHTPAETWPWQGYALAAHLLRAMNGLIGLCTLLFVYGSGRLLWPTAPTKALLATALVAFLPQFLFLHGAINNDGLIICLSSAVLWQLLRLWYTAVTPPRLLLLGSAIGLAILTKMTGLLLLVLAAGVIINLWLRTTQENNLSDNTTPHLRPLLLHLLLLIMPTLLISGWLLWRNWALYGDPTATNQFVVLAGGDREYTLRQVWGDRERIWFSLFATFGWMNLRPPAWVYWVWHSILALSGAAAFWSLWSSRHTHIRHAWLHSPAPWLAAWVGLVLAAWLRFMLQTPADQGRLLFPALLPLALALAHGLSQLRARPALWLSVLLALATSVYSLFVTIPQAYALPQIVTPADIPGTAVQIYQDMGYGLILVAGEPHTAVAHPTELVSFTLYWQAIAASSPAPITALKLFGRDDAVIASQSGYHGRGLYPAALWPLGDAVIAETIYLRLDAAIDTPVIAHLLVAHPDIGNATPAGSVKIIPPTWPRRETAVLAQLGSAIEVTAVTLSHRTATPGEMITVAITWQVTAMPGQDLTTFIHLGDPKQTPLAQADGIPRNGAYPTRYWAAGEQFSDSYTLLLPAALAPGQYPIQFGLYDSQSGARLPLFIDGARQPQDAYRVGSLTIIR